MASNKNEKGYLKPTPGKERRTWKGSSLDFDGSKHTERWKPLDSDGRDSGLHTERWNDEPLDSDRRDSGFQNVFKTEDAGNGIEIILSPHGLPDGDGFSSEAWSSEERRQFLEVKSFSDVETFQTNIFHIYKTSNSSNRTSNEALYYPDIEPSNITIRVHLPKISQMNSLCLTFQAHIRFMEKWEILEAAYQQDTGTVTFHTNQIESFFILSTPPKDKLIITPAGYKYESKADKRIKIDFPANTVSLDEEVEVQIIPMNRETLAKKIESNPRNCFILALSECLLVQHSIPSFDMPVKIQLPVDDLPGIESKDVECKYGVFRREKNTVFKLTKLKVIEENGEPTIAVSSFSEYVIIRVQSDMFERVQDLLPEEIEIARGNKMCCKILFFISNIKPNSLSVMLECITKDSLEDVTQQRKQIGYELVRQCPSPDLFFPVNLRIRVNVGGRFSLPKDIGKGYYLLTFFPASVDNFIIFPVEKHSSMGTPPYGIITFKEDNYLKKDLHVIHYDPWSSKWKSAAPIARKQPLPSTNAPSFQQRNVLHENFTVKDFFPDRALLCIAEQLSPESMFRVVIHLGVSLSRYLQIRSDHVHLTAPLQHLQLLKTALDDGDEDTKIHRLSCALRDSDENSLANRIEDLYSRNMKITKGNLQPNN